MGEITIQHERENSERQLGLSDSASNNSTAIFGVISTHSRNSRHKLDDARMLRWYVSDWGQPVRRWKARFDALQRTESFANQCKLNGARDWRLFARAVYSLHFSFSPRFSHFFRHFSTLSLSRNLFLTLSPPIRACRDWLRDDSILKWNYVFKRFFFKKRCSWR